jgi:hypothetical protein
MCLQRLRPFPFPRAHRHVSIIQGTFWRLVFLSFSFSSPISLLSSPISVFLTFSSPIMSFFSLSSPSPFPQLNRYPSPHSRHQAFLGLNLPTQTPVKILSWILFAI